MMVTLEAHDKVKDDFTESEKKTGYLTDKLCNFETALEALLTLWHISYQEVEGHPLVKLPMHEELNN